MNKINNFQLINSPRIENTLFACVFLEEGVS